MSASSFVSNQSFDNNFEMSLHARKLHQKQEWIQKSIDNVNVNSLWDYYVLKWGKKRILSVLLKNTIIGGSVTEKEAIDRFCNNKINSPFMVEPCWTLEEMDTNSMGVVLSFLSKFDIKIVKNVSRKMCVIALNEMQKYTIIIYYVDGYLTTCCRCESSHQIGKTISYWCKRAGVNVKNITILNYNSGEILKLNNLKYPIFEWYTRTRTFLKVTIFNHKNYRLVSKNPQIKDQYLIDTQIQWCYKLFYYDVYEKKSIHIASEIRYLTTKYSDKGDTYDHLLDCVWNNFIKQKYPNPKDKNWPLYHQKLLGVINAAQESNTQIKKNVIMIRNYRNPSLENCLNVSDKSDYIFQINTHVVWTHLIHQDWYFITYPNKWQKKVSIVGIVDQNKFELNLRRVDTVKKVKKEITLRFKVAQKDRIWIDCDRTQLLQNKEIIHDSCVNFDDPQVTPCIYWHVFKPFGFFVKVKYQCLKKKKDTHTLCVVPYDCQNNTGFIQTVILQLKQDLRFQRHFEHTFVTPNKHFYEISINGETYSTIKPIIPILRTNSTLIPENVDQICFFKNVLTVQIQLGHAMFDKGKMCFISWETENLIDIIPTDTIGNLVHQEFEQEKFYKYKCTPRQWEWMFWCAGDLRRSKLAQTPQKPAKFRPFFPMIKEHVNGTKLVGLFY